MSQKPMSLTQRLLDGLLQIFWLTVLFFLLTGGAFLLDRDAWEYLSGQRPLFRLLLHGIFGLALLAGIARWRHQPASFFELEPVRTIRALLTANPARVLAGLSIFYTLTQTTSLIFMHEGMGTALWDFGFNDQIIWNTAHGNFLINSVRGGQNVLGEHFFLFLAFLSPIYVIQNHAWPVFLIQSAAIEACIPLTYAIARTAGLRQPAGIALAAAVFFYVPMRSGILFPFHSETFADPFLLLGCLAALRRKTLFAILGWALALTCKENIPVELFGIGLFLISRREKRGWLAMGMAVACLLVVTKVIEPHYRFDYQWNKWGFYSHITHPSPEGMKIILRSILSPNPLPFLILVFGPLAFFSFLAPGWVLLLGPSLAARLISPMPGFRIITAHYTVGLNALVFISAAFGAAALIQKRRFSEMRLSALVLVAALFFSGIPQLFDLENYTWEASAPANQRIVRVLRSIPRGLSVMSTETFLAQLTHREYLFGYDSVKPGAPLWLKSILPDLAVVDTGRLQGNEKLKLEELRSGGYQQAFQTDHLIIYARPELKTDALIEEWNKLAAQPDYPWRKKIRKIYKRLLVAALIVMIAFYFIRQFRTQKPAAKGHAR